MRVRLSGRGVSAAGCEGAGAAPDCFLGGELAGSDSKKKLDTRGDLEDDRAETIGTSAFDSAGTLVSTSTGALVKSIELVTFGRDMEFAFLNNSGRV